MYCQNCEGFDDFNPTLQAKKLPCHSVMDVEEGIRFLITDTGQLITQSNGGSQKTGFCCWFLSFSSQKARCL